MKNQVKYYLDFVPLLIVILYAGFSIGTMVSRQNTLQWQHYLGIALLLLDIVVLIKHHQSGIILFGFTLLLGLLTIVSFEVGLQVETISLTAARIPVFWGNSMCLLWLIIHLIFSFRFYVGILTKDYWRQLFKETRFV